MSDEAEGGDGGALLRELGDGGVDFSLAEFIDWHALNDFPFAAVGADGEGGHETGLDAVAAVRADSDAGPVARWGRRGEGGDGIASCIGGGGGGGETAGFDNGGATLLDSGDEVALEPVMVADDLGGGLAIDFGVKEVGILGGGVVAPDAEIGDGGDVGASFGGELAFGAVFVETGHSEPAVSRDVFGIIHRDEAVGVAGVAHHEDANV